MSLESAQSQFLDLMRSLPNANTQKLFGDWIKRVVLPELEQQVEVEQNIVSARIRLNQISSYLSSVVPVEAVLPSEQIQFPSQGEDAALNALNSVHVDAFLYDEEEEDRLVQQGALSRAYCKQCGSKNTESLRYITHSCSKSRLEFIFTRLLPPLDPSKRILDVGSRLGSVLFGAYLYTPANQIYGIEINKDFCDLQQATVEKYQMQQRIQVLHKEMTTVPELVSSMDVVILNNVFDWFMPQEQQIKMWQFLYNHCKKGALLVTIPSVDDSLELLQTGIVISKWLRPLNPRIGQSQLEDEEVETSEVKLYEVILER